MLKKIVVKGAKEIQLKKCFFGNTKRKISCYNWAIWVGKSSLAFDTIYAEGQKICRKPFVLC